MINKTSRWVQVGFQVGAIVLALVFTTLILIIMNAPTGQTYRSLITGAFGTQTKIADVFVSWIPLLLVTSGLLITFSAGLWNIGIEGQITMGAIFATWILRLLQESNLSTGIILICAMVAGIIGGGLWAALAGVLKTFGNVNEIFGGLGLNFVSQAVTLWLIFGPWKRPGTGSMSGTQPFPVNLWLPTVEGLRFSWYSLFIGLAGLALVYILLQGTYFGLRLKAVGKNMKAAHLLGIPTVRYMISAFILCGLFGGLAGSLQVVGVYHRLIPSISSGYGFMGLMVAMLINFQTLWVMPIAFFFVALNIGSIQLPIVLKLDSNFAGVLQGAMVLSVLLMNGVRKRILQKQEEKMP